VAKKGGALPAFAELELIRREHAVAVRRYCARLGIPVSTWYHWRAADLAGRPLRRRAAPVVDAIAGGGHSAALVSMGPSQDLGDAYAPTAWRSAAAPSPARCAARACCRRAYQRERRQPAATRRATFVEPRARRNRVWQMDFSEFETAGGGTWRIGGVVDYAAKVCLATHISGTSTARDATAALAAAIGCVDPLTGECIALTIVTDIGPALKSIDFGGFIRARPWLAHVRTRHHAPETNGVVERFFGSLKYEHLFRLEIGDVMEMAEAVDHYRTIYNTVRPHEALDFGRPLERHLSEPVEPHLFQPQSVQST
jgi:transposase InsO family protein